MGETFRRCGSSNRVHGGTKKKKKKKKKTTVIYSMDKLSAITQFLFRDERPRHSPLSVEI